MQSVHCFSMCHIVVLPSSSFALGHVGVGFLGFSMYTAMSSANVSKLLLHVLVYVFVYLPHCIFLSNHMYSCWKGNGEELGYMEFWLSVEIYPFTMLRKKLSH